MSKLSQSVLQKIQAEQKKPLPHWVFLLRNIFLWGLLIVSVFFIGIFLGGFILNLTSLNWEFASRWPGAHLGFFRDAFEGIWFFGILFALVGAFLLFRFTKRGYRYRLSLIITYLLFISFGLGLGFLFTPLPRFMHEWHRQHIPMTIHTSTFNSPENGRIVGDLVEINGDTAYLRTPDGTEWELWLFGSYPVDDDDFVLVFGEVIDKNIFAVTDMRPVPENYFVQE